MQVMELMPVVNIDCASTAKKEDKNRKGKSQRGFAGEL